MSIPVSKLDPLGLVPVSCQHGLPFHPTDPQRQADFSKFGKTWVRSRYARSFGCVVCEGQPAPPDLHGEPKAVTKVWCYLQNLEKPVHECMEGCMQPDMIPYCLNGTAYRHLQMMDAEPPPQEDVVVVHLSNEDDFRPMEVDESDLYSIEVDE